MEDIDFNSLYIKAAEAEAKVEELAAGIEAAQASEQATFAQTLDSPVNTVIPELLSNASLLDSFPLAVFNFKNKISALSNLSSILTGSQSSKPDHSASIQQPLKKPGAKIYTQTDANKRLNKHPDDGGLVPKKSKLSRLGGPIADVFPGSIGDKDVCDTNIPSISYAVHTPGSVSEAQENEAGSEIVITSQGDVCQEPASSFAPVYPLNKASESESGHFRELDDTPGAERIKESHRTGTYYEIHPDGSKTTKVVSDNFEVVIGSDYTKIKGTCAVHIEQNAELFCHGDVNMMSMGEVDVFALTQASITALGQASVVGLGEAYLASLGKAAVTSTAKTSIFSTGATEVVGVASVDVISAGIVNMVGGPGLNLATDGIMTFSDSTESQTLLGLTTAHKVLVTGTGYMGVQVVSQGTTLGTTAPTGTAGKAAAAAAAKAALAT